MSIDESFDSFYGKLNEIVIAKLNLREKIEDAKVVRKILRSLSEREKTLMRLKFKNSLGLNKLMSYLYHHKGRATLLLSRQSMSDWKPKTP